MSTVSCILTSVAAFAVKATCGHKWSMAMPHLGGWVRIVPGRANTTSGFGPSERPSWEG